MLEIKTDNIEELKDALESLAYQIANVQFPNRYWIEDSVKADILKCEGLEVEIKD